MPFRNHRVGNECVNRIQGMQAQITKAVLSQALLFMSKEQFEHWALAIMVMFAKLALGHGTLQDRHSR